MSKQENGKKNIAGRIFGAALIGAGVVALARTARALLDLRTEKAVRTYGEPEPEYGDEAAEEPAVPGTEDAAPAAYAAGEVEEPAAADPIPEAENAEAPAAESGEGAEA